jgi:hypothetical protein
MMAGKQIFNPEGFKNVEQDGRVIGFQFQFKIQYYRGITLSIIRDIPIWIDNEKVDRENIRFSVNGEDFTLEEMRTVIDPDYRWEFGEWATVTVLKDGGLKRGNHHIKAVQIVAPSYMPRILEDTCECDFVTK